MAITFAKGELLALCFEFLLFGSFSILALITLLVLLRIEDPQAARSAKILPAGLVLMFCVALAHMALSATDVLGTFFSTEGADTLYAELSYYTDPFFLARGAIMNLQVILGDCINVLDSRVFTEIHENLHLHRLWLVSDRGRLPIFPPVLGVFVYVITAIIGGIWGGASAFEFGNVWVTACAGLTLYVNVYCTVAISRRIYETRTTHAISVSTHPALMAIIESGALWTAAVIAFMFTYSLSSLGVLIVIDAIVPYVGIVFCLIILQVRYLRYKRTFKPQMIPELQLPMEVSHCSTALPCASPSLHVRGASASSGYTVPYAVHITEEVEMYCKEEGLDKY